ncbi:transcriptional regulator, XRE family (plasmid) [Gloeothece citriformis PCC 7424]|uniref:Transcriptional regulator, XRE family n=1 Tax=Gloeothece citriformis (strain PCC 7424) TaxID=65393 RepID=B7KME8_GLOC7|nr:zinc ribbon domain-containing protein [Gloeothece citriformis]ACK73970.1 transcriptional regulator, XRE family [Gloeothece citriformis PCC 7424]
MTILTDNRPQDGESLAQYLRRVRTSLKMSQGEMATKAGLHIQSLGKIEAGKTTRLNGKTKAGLSRALGIPEDYLDALCRGVPVTSVQHLKICPQCWSPGSSAEPIWLDPRSKYCFICGTSLIDRCPSCQELIPSLKFRFCGYCGQPYKKISNYDSHIRLGSI